VEKKYINPFFFFMKKCIREIQFFFKTQFIKLLYSIYHVACHHYIQTIQFQKNKSKVNNVLVYGYTNLTICAP